MNVFSDSVKIANQIRGKENMFGYKTMCAVFAVTFESVCYVLYADKNDTPLLLYVVLTVATVATAPFVGMILHLSNLLDAIQAADDIIAKRERNPHQIKKVKNHDYYFLYTPKLDEYGSFEFYLIYNGILGLFGTSVFVIWPMIPFLFIVFTVICHDEIQQIIIDVNSLGSNTDMTMDMELYKKIEPEFRTTVVNCVRDFQHVLKMIECFRDSYETIATTMLPVLLYIEIIHAFYFISPNTSITVHVREVSMFLAAIQFVYVLCWTGQMLDELTSMLSFAAYSTPWYWSTSFRKDVNILICQTQRPVSATALATYPLSLATFLRFMHVIQSSVNVLRKMTSK
ncbi:odorant receptor 7a [Planococcus citri]|uniref:odorant receptor 7a n=1 Tax=Planococcus citri TaxID=170843 RepID=UPI0031FA1120